MAWAARAFAATPGPSSTGGSPLQRSETIHQVSHVSTKDPCISICKFDDDICRGCGRSKREIKSWKKMDKDEKRAVLAASAARLKDLKKAAGRRKKK